MYSDGWAVGLGKIWDGINDPLFGLISDRLRTRWGRRRGVLLLGAVPLGVSFMLMWLVPPLILVLLGAGQAAVILIATVFILYPPPARAPPDW